MTGARSLLAAGAGAGALAAIVVALAFPGEWIGGVRAGAMFSMASPDWWLAILGIGLVLGAQDRRTRPVIWVSLIGGAVSGIAVRHSALWPLLSNPSIFRFVRLVGPSACALSGLGLLLNNRWRSPFLTILTFATATGLWFTAAVNDPTSEGYGFAAGFSLACLCLATAAALVRRSITGSWTRVGERIAGSWLLTIGVLLSATQWFPVAPPMIDAPLPPTPVVSKPLGFPEPDVVIRPDGERNPMGFGGLNGLPRGTN
ncbi:hypothetical protein [uncultured Aureimonas sp.]|uniref:hypothetical protein n=1 Tax=uncultured Aureimonas sp. TaxID=1604662 RepID=UPI0025E4DF91|nr:hypothetical protein [uncultured Aureimonas sp.]